MKPERVLLLFVVCGVLLSDRGMPAQQTAPARPGQVQQPKQEVQTALQPRESVQLPAVVQPEQRRAVGRAARSPVRIRRDLIRNGVVFDARGQNVFFPVPEQPRRFESPEAFARAVSKDTGGVVLRSARGPIVAGHAVQVGASYWVDRRTRLVYRVRDAMQAWLGGTTGRIVVAGRDICVDPDGTCGAGMPSYLVPVVKPTSREPDTIRPPCASTGGVIRCAEYHSFFNKINLRVLNWARHGATTRLVAGKGAAVNRLSACPAGTPAPDADLPVDHLVVSLRTEGDDLREASHAFLTVTLAARPGLPAPPRVGDLPRVSVNDGAGLNSGTVFTSRRLTLPRGTLIGHIDRLTLFHDSRQRNPFDTRDNWDLSQVNVVAEVSTPAGREQRNLVGQGKVGGVVHGFSGTAPTLSLSIAAGEAPEICFESVAPAVALQVQRATLQRRPSGSGLIAFHGLPDVRSEGVEEVATAVFFIGAGFEIETDAMFEASGVGPGSAPTDLVVWAADGLCAGHGTNVGPPAFTGAGDHDCSAEIRGLPR
jgi:hypothetical protein